MLGLLGALRLLTQKSSDYSGPPPFIVGEALEFLIEGGIPGAAISWSSWKDGQPTGEQFSYYGQTLDDQGMADLYAGNFALADVGSWTKRVHILDANGQPTTFADVSFTVQQKTQPTAPTRSTPIWPPPNTLPPSPTQPAIPGQGRPVAPASPIPSPVPPATPGDILNPPRTIAAPRDPIIPRDTESRPIATPIFEYENSPPIIEPAPPDILNPPVTTPVSQAPVTQTPTTPTSQAASSGLNSAVKIAGYDIPVWALGVGLLFLFMGRR